MSLTNVLPFGRLLSAGHLRNPKLTMDSTAPATIKGPQKPQPGLSKPQRIAMVCVHHAVHIYIYVVILSYVAYLLLLCIA